MNRNLYVIDVQITTVGFVEAVGCEGGWVNVPLRSHTSCYKFVTTAPATWSEAQGLCRDMGGYLATLDTLEEIIWMRGYRNYHSGLQAQMWIGGYKKNGVWLWKGELADSPVLIFDWGEHQPDDNGAGLQNCLSLFGINHPSPRLNSPTKGWFHFDDTRCEYYKMQYICEKNI